MENKQVVGLVGPGESSEKDVAPRPPSKNSPLQFFIFYFFIIFFSLQIHLRRGSLDSSVRPPRSN